MFCIVIGRLVSAYISQCPYIVGLQSACLRQLEKNWKVSHELQAYASVKRIYI